MIKLWKAQFSPRENIMVMDFPKGIEQFLEVAGKEPVEIPFNGELPKHQKTLAVPKDLWKVGYSFNLLQSGDRCFWITGTEIGENTTLLFLTYDPLLSNARNKDIKFAGAVTQMTEPQYAGARPHVSIQKYSFDDEGSMRQPCIPMKVLVYDRAQANPGHGNNKPFMCIPVIVDTYGTCMSIIKGVPRGLMAKYKSGHLRHAVTYQELTTAKGFLYAHTIMVNPYELDAFSTNDWSLDTLKEALPNEYEDYKEENQELTQLVKNTIWFQDDEKEPPYISRFPYTDQSGMLGLITDYDVDRSITKEFYPFSFWRFVHPQFNDTLYFDGLNIEGNFKGLRLLETIGQAHDFKLIKKHTKEQPGNKEIPETSYEPLFTFSLPPEPTSVDAFKQYVNQNPFASGAGIVIASALGIMSGGAAIATSAPLLGALGAAGAVGQVTNTVGNYNDLKSQRSDISTSGAYFSAISTAWFNSIRTFGNQRVVSFNTGVIHMKADFNVLPSFTRYGYPTMIKYTDRYPTIQHYQYIVGDLTVFNCENDQTEIESRLAEGVELYRYSDSWVFRPYTKDIFYEVPKFYQS